MKTASDAAPGNDNAFDSITALPLRELIAAEIALIAGAGLEDEYPLPTR